MDDGQTDDGVTPSQAAALGAVQGVAEVVPVSSSAQLVLLPWLLGWQQPADRTTFAAALHGGSTLGVAFALRRDLRELATTRAGRRHTLLLAASSLPAALAGAALHDAVERRLGRPPQLAALLATAGAVLWAADRRAQDVGRVDARQAAAAGLAQVTALAPGVSRTGATLTALRLCRVERAEAARFSLLMSLPVTAGAAALTLARADRSTTRALAAPASAGVLAAAVSGGLAATAWRRRPAGSATLPAVYRLGLAAVVAARLRRPVRPAVRSARPDADPVLPRHREVRRCPT